MTRLRDALIENYASHYARLNTNIDPRACSASSNNRWHVILRDLVKGLPPESRVLDLGCGTGFLLNSLSTHSNLVPVGVDSSATQVEIAKSSLPGIEISCMDGLEYLKQHVDSFSGIFCYDVLEHIPGDDLCYDWLTAVRAALKPGGFFLCRTPNAASLLGCYTRYMDLTHVRSLATPSMLQLLDTAGFDRCQILPYRTGHVLGWVRLRVESMLHRVIYRICGNSRERVFTKNIYGLGFKKGN